MLAFHELIIGAEEIGAHPTSMKTLVELMEDPLVGAEVLVPIVEQDPGLTANLLKLCNSSSYGFTREIGTVHEALVMVGNTSFTKMAFMICVENVLLKDLNTYRIQKHDIWRHSLSVAVGSAYLARKMGMARLKDWAFTAGILHDVGKLILDEPLKGMVDKTDYQGIAGITREREDEITGFDHGEAAAAVLMYWDFPQLLVQAVRNHHTPGGSGVHADISKFIYAADMISHLIDKRIGFDPDDMDSPFIPVLDAGITVAAVVGLQTVLYDSAGDILKVALRI